MPALSLPRTLTVTAWSVCIGALGLVVALLLDIPAAPLTGPALAVSIAGLAGLEVDVDARLRELCFIVLGVGIGGGFNTEATAAVLRWPLAFVALAAGLYATLVICREVMARFFDFPRRDAILASAPGHLSFVMSLAADARADVGRIAVVQSIRLLALTLAVPLVAHLMGFEIDITGFAGGNPMSLPPVVALGVLGLGLGLVFRRLKLPAPLLLGAMAISGGAHLGGAVDGGLPKYLLLPAFMVMGTLIGARFSGITPRALVSALGAGGCVTVVATVIAAAAAMPVAAFLGMPPAAVLAAFAPGGFETMIALGVALGGDPGFVAACHIMRLLILAVLIPFTFGRARA